jgi:hypothetical protein
MSLYKVKNSVIGEGVSTTNVSEILICMVSKTCHFSSAVICGLVSVHCSRFFFMYRDAD